MDSAGKSLLTEEQISALKAAWGQAATVQDAGGTDAALALGFGINIRVHLVEALKAAWETTQAAIKITGVIHTPFDPWGWLDASAEVLSAVQAVLTSLVERMRPVDYIAAVILSGHPQGLSASALQEKVERFVAQPELGDFAWYLCMRGSKVVLAKQALEREGWFGRVLENLRKADFVAGDADCLTFKPKHYDISWSAV